MTWLLAPNVNLARKCLQIEEWFNWLHQHYQTNWGRRMPLTRNLVNISSTTINIYTLTQVTQGKMIDDVWRVSDRLASGCFHCNDGKLYINICLSWKLKHLKNIILEVVLGVYRRKTFIIWTWLLTYSKMRLNQWKLFLLLQLTEQDGGSGRVGRNKCLLRDWGVYCPFVIVYCILKWARLSEIDTNDLISCLTVV